MSLADKCPFHAPSAISDPRFFVGREESLRILNSRMMAVQSSSVNIIGDHLTGKSSLLIYFVNTYQQRIPNANDRFIVVYLSLQNATCHTQETLFDRLVELIETKLSEINYSATGELQRRLRNREWKAAKFNHLLSEFKNQNMMPVLCIDDFEELLERTTEFPNSFYDNLRFLVSNGYLMIIMASREDLKRYSQRKQITSDFFNVFQTINLNKGFSETEARQLIALSNSQGESLNSQLQNTALKWEQTNPCLLQLAGQKLWDVQINGKSIEWAKEEFHRQAKRLSNSPKSPLLSILYNIIDKLGFSVNWLIENGKKHWQFVLGFLFLALVFAILIASSYNVVTFSQLKDVVEGILSILK